MQSRVHGLFLEVGELLSQIGEEMGVESGTEFVFSEDVKIENILKIVKTD